MCFGIQIQQCYCVGHFNMFCLLQDSDSDTGHKKKKARIVESDEESDDGGGVSGKQSGSESEKHNSGSESE